MLQSQSDDMFFIDMTFFGTRPLHIEKQKEYESYCIEKAQKKADKFVANIEDSDGYHADFLRYLILPNHPDDGPFTCVRFLYKVKENDISYSLCREFGPELT